MSIEEIILNYLLDQNLSVGSEIYLETPVKPPETYITIERTSGGKTDHIKFALIAIKAISRKSLITVIDLNEEIKTAMEGITVLNEIFSANLNSDSNFTNTSTKEYRYQATFNVYF